MPQTFPVSAVGSGGPVGPRRWRLGLLVGLALCFGLAPRVSAAKTCTVCASGCDYASIQTAIAAPTTVDGDTLAIAVGTYTEAGIVVNKSLILQGEGAASTISANSASLMGSGLANNRSLTLRNSIVANNTKVANCENFGSITSKGYNLDSDPSCQLTAPTDLPGIDPQLAPLQDNGGPTFTQALLHGMPGATAASCVAAGLIVHPGDQVQMHVQGAAE